MPFRTAKTKIYQYDIVVGGRRFRGSCGTTDFEEAKAVEAQVRAEAKSSSAMTGRFTLSEALGTYIRDKMLGRPSEATTKSQAREILKHIDGKTPIADLTDATILNYVAKARATCANATVNRRLQMLGRALRHMQKYKAEIPDLDLRGAETKEPKERVRELSFDEQARLFDALPTEYRPFVTFALMTGARIETISNLLWSDVSLDRSEIVFRLKGDDMMTFPINAEIKALLSALPRSNVLAHRSRVFTRVDRQTMDRVPIVSNGGVFGTAWRKALKDAEIDDFRFHDLRHTFATRMLRQTQNLKLVSRLLGHRTLDATMKYAHVLIDDMRAAMDDFSAFSGTEELPIPQNKPQTQKRK